MNSLNSNPKKTMFYAAAQNMLNQHSNQSSMQNLKRSLFQLAMIPGNNYKEQLNSSLNNNSDRAIPNFSLPKRSILFQGDKDRSLSYKQNISLENNSSVERAQNAYNIKGHFQAMNEDPSQVAEKEQKKQELKEYLLKQIEDKKKQQQQEQQRKKIEDAKAEQLLRKQLEEIKQKQLTKKNVAYPMKISQQNQQNRDGLFMQIYSLKSQQNGKQNDILDKLNYIQNDLMSMQQSTSQKLQDVSSVRNNIKSMIRKQASINPEQVLWIKKPELANEKQLDCETIFIPANSRLGQIVADDYQDQTQEDVNKSVQSFHHIRPNSNLQRQNLNQTTLSNPLNISQHISSIQNNTHAENAIASQIVNHSRLTISQLTSRDRSLSAQKVQQSHDNVLQKVEELKDEIRGVKPQQKKPIQNNLQLKLPHRTTMLMQMPSKNSNQSQQKIEEPKSSQRI